MFDPVIIKNQFMGLVGLRQNDNPDFPQLASTLLYTENNVLVEHPLVNIENIDMVARNYATLSYPAYVPATVYAADTNQALVRVSYGGKYYRSLQAGNNGNQPDVSPLFWEEVNLLSNYLEDLFKSANQDAVVSVFNKKKISRVTKSLLRNLRLFEGTGNINDRVVNESYLVGLQITLKYNQNIVALIEKIGLQLTEAQNLTMYLYHSSQIEPIATVDIVHTKSVSFEWHSASLKLQYNDPSIEPGGTFFLMYDQDDLVGQAVWKRHNFHLRPCTYCDRAVLETFNLYTKYLDIRSVRVSAANRNADNDLWLWDITQTEFVPDCNFGLNLEVTMKCDLSQFLVTQRDQFAFAVRDTVIFKLLQAMANSTRQNHNQTKLDAMARAELTAKYAGGMGFMERMEKQYEAVEVEISELDSTCMPCSASRRGLHYGSASLGYGR